jgi:hypothetical protein
MKWGLMTERELRTQSNQYNAATAVTMGYQEIINSAANYQNIMRAFADGRAKDLNDEPKKLLEPVFITGSGPSFDDNVEKLKDWKGGIISHYSQAPTLMYHGIEPDYIVALDAICNWEGLRGVDWSKTKTKLVLHPGMWPSLVENWPNEMLFYRQSLGKSDAFGVSTQKIMYSERLGTLQDALDSKVALKPLIKTELTMFACTPPAQLFVAHVLQYGRVFLCGVDFAYHGGRMRMTNYERDTPNDEWVKREYLRDPNVPYIITTNGLETEQLHLYYKKNFISAARLSMQQVYTTDHGAIVEMPYAPIDSVIKKQGRTTKWDIPPKTRELNYERYLAGIGCYVVNFEYGSSFVEAANPIPDLTSFMVARNRHYTCQNCHTEATAQNDEDNNGKPCHLCGQPKMKQTNKADLKANLNRIQSLIDYVKETT